MTETKRPHIIIFNPDQMRADALAHLGNPAAVTPNLDKFAQEDAVSFSQAYCQNPVCVPSRCSFFTGLYPHVRGHRTMAHLLHPGETSLLKELKESGYYVWMNDRNDLTAGQVEGWTESHADEIYYSGQQKRGPGRENPGIRGERGGKYYYSHFGGKLKVDENGINYSNDDETVDAAIERILHPEDDRPVCLFLGLMYPHVPYQVEESYYSMIDREKLPERILPEKCSGKSRIMDLIRKYQNMESFTEDDWKEMRAVYLGMCAKVDAQFGRMVRALKDAGIYDDCAIFFLSDHGDFTGDYGISEKAQNTFEDCLTRVPLLIKPPKDCALDAGVSDAMAELVDFYATAMDYAGVKPTHTHFGRSLRENIGDRSLPGRSYVFCEGGRQPGETHCDEYHRANGGGTPETAEYWPRLWSQTDDEAHAKGIMIRSKRYKYVSRTVGRDELYDLQLDPGETYNRIDVPEYQRIKVLLSGEMLKWLQSTADIVPFELDQRFTKEMLWAKVRGMVPPEAEKEVRDLIDNHADFQYLMQYCAKLNGDKK